MKAWLLACLFSGIHPGQAPSVRLPDESEGIAGVVRTLISAFDQVDIVGLGEDHESKEGSDLRIALVRHPDFAKKVRSIVVEFGSTTSQSTLDRYIRGENVPRAQLEQVWKTTTQGADTWTTPIYPAFFAAVRDVNSKLPASARIRVFGGDPGPGDGRNRDTAAVSLLKEQVIRQHGKALVIYGAAHFFRTEGDVADVFNDGGEGTMMMKLGAEYPGRTLAVLPVGGPPTHTKISGPDTADYGKFDRALRTQVRPVLVPLRRPPFRDFTAEEFIGRKLLTGLRGPGLVSVFKGSKLTLGQLADACAYFGHSQ
ncbi:MAG: hypothetical protein ACHQ50_04885 [Fimbriimonadales bacterium]